MKLTPQPKSFATRDDLINHVAALAKLDRLPDQSENPMPGGRRAAQARLSEMDAVAYGQTRNHLDGRVTRLSPYIRHGIVTLNEVRNLALDSGAAPKQIEKFIQELGWRDFWQRIYDADPECLWGDIESYKTGFQSGDYADDLPEDVEQGATGVACLDQFIQTLRETGYLHNHARMYLAAYVVHWRRVKWQAGAKWFLSHLADADPASNNLSWQWVASTFSNKPYFFNLENVAKFTGPDINTEPKHNLPLAASYEALAEKLFPFMEAS
ncbi:MAG: FAD-binding domain-containing protein [Parvibaculales bacterium]